MLQSIAGPTHRIPRTPQTEPVRENRGLHKAVGIRRRDFERIPAPRENSKIDLLSADINQPVFPHAGFEVALGKLLCGFVESAAADDLGDHIRRAGDLNETSASHAALPLRNPTGLQRFPTAEYEIGFVGNVRRFVDKQGVVGEDFSDVVFLQQIPEFSIQRGFHLGMRFNFLGARVNNDLPRI